MLDAHYICIVHDTYKKELFVSRKSCPFKGTQDSLWHSFFYKIKTKEKIQNYCKPSPSMVLISPGEPHGERRVPFLHCCNVVTNSIRPQSSCERGGWRVSREESVTSIKNGFPSKTECNTFRWHYCFVIFFHLPQRNATLRSSDERFWKYRRLYLVAPCCRIERPWRAAWSN